MMVKNLISRIGKRSGKPIIREYIYGKLIRRYHKYHWDHQVYKGVRFEMRRLES